MTTTTDLPLILIAPNVRTAHMWCRDNNVTPYARNVVKIVTTADSLRGMGAGRRVVVINPGGPIWMWRNWLKMSDNLNILKSVAPFESYKEVWL
jgi:hypothetical protein